MKNILKRILPIIDIILIPFLYLSAKILRSVRIAGVHRMPLSKKIFNKVGVFPIIDHYFEPLFNPKHIRHPLNTDRKLPGIDFNIEEQLKLINSFKFNNEILGLFNNKNNNNMLNYIDSGFANTPFKSGDAEFWYSILRLKKPKIIIEIGSGYSTLVAKKALSYNYSEEINNKCKHICIEPFQNKWLEKTGVTVIREKVEKLNYEPFLELDNNDILFIDSSHIIRPQGDVLFEYLDLLPRLKKGVIVHVHDIFTPRDYLHTWVVDRVRFWNEQYLLEAFLTLNTSWKIIAALNFLHHNYYEQLSKKCPFLSKDREPGSFYIQKIA